MSHKSLVQTPLRPVSFVHETQKHIYLFISFIYFIYLSISFILSLAEHITHPQLTNVF